MTSQMLTSPRENDSFAPLQAGISSSPEHVAGEGSKLEAAPDTEFEPELETESESDTDAPSEIARAVQEGILHATANQKIEPATENGANIQNDDLLPPSPPPQSMQESIGPNEDPADDDRFVSKHHHAGNTGANAVSWDELRKRHAVAGPKTSTSAVKMELEELRRKQLAKSGKNLLSEKALSEANKRKNMMSEIALNEANYHRFTPQSHSSATAGYLSEIEFHLSQRARSNELKKRQMETLEFYHSYRGRNVEKEKAQPSSPTRDLDERRHSFSPSASPFGTSPRSTSLSASLTPTVLPLSTLDEGLEKPDGVEKRAVSEPHITTVGTLEHDWERRLATYSPRTQRSIRVALSRGMLNEGVLPEPELSEPKSWDEKVNDCPILPHGEDDIKQFPEDNAGCSSNTAEEKECRENKRASVDASGERIVNEKERPKSRIQSSSKESKKPNKKNVPKQPRNISNAPKKSLSSTEQSAKKKKEGKHDSDNTSERALSSTQRSTKKEKAIKKQREERSTPDVPVAEIVIRPSSKSPKRTRKIAKEENGSGGQSQQKNRGKVKSSADSKLGGKESVGKRTIPPRPSEKKKKIVPRVATLATKPPRLSPLRSRSEPCPAPNNRRRCNSAPTTGPSAFGSDSSVCMPIENTRRKKAVPLYNGRAVAINYNTKRNHSLYCERKWEVNLYGSRAGCDRCLHFASEEEKKSFAVNGHHHRIMMTRGGCHRSCTFFPRKKNELPARLCHKCFHDTHELKLW